MTKPKKQKRYLNALEIQGEITAFKQKAQRRLATAEECEAKACELVKEANKEGLAPHEVAFLIETAGNFRDKAARARRSCFLIFDQHIPQLVRTMGAYKTQTMEFMQDNAITLQK